jgi:pterin-4a-carbinolamine dehydratase
MYNKVVRQAAVKLSSQDVATHLSKLPGWKTQGDSLEKDFKLANFEETWVRALTQF